MNFFCNYNAIYGLDLYSLILSKAEVEDLMIFFYESLIFGRDDKDEYTFSENFNDYFYYYLLLLLIISIDG